MNPSLLQNSPADALAQRVREMRTLLDDLLSAAVQLRDQLPAEDPHLAQILHSRERLVDLSDDFAKLIAAPAPSPAPASTPASVVLCVEDNRANFMLMERVLKRRPNVRMINATRGDMALEIARRERPALIFLDLNLPDLHGSEVLARLHTDPATRGIPVVVVSADASARQIDRLLLLGARNYLTKPINIERLLQTVDEVIPAPAPE